MNKEKSNFEGIENILKRVLPSENSNFLKKVYVVDNIEDLWNEVVGEPFSNHTKPVKIKNGTLIVNVNSSVILQELNNYSKNELLEILQDKWPWLNDIKFKAGDV